MKMSPIKKIVIGLAAITVALSLITANNMASVMLIVASREAGSATQQSAQTNAPAQQSQSTNNSQSSSTDTGATDNTATDNTATTNAATDNTAPTDAATDNKTEDKAPADDKKPADDKGNAGASTADKEKAEILEYFNTASSNVKTKAKSVTKVKEENYQAQPIDLGGLGAFKGLVSGLIDDNMGVNEEQSGRTGTTVADKNAIYPVENEAWSSKLTVEDVESVTRTEKNGVYTITIKVKNDELATEYAHGTGHHGKAFNIVMPQTIKDNAGGAASLLGSLKVGYQNGTIVATVDKATGNLISANYDFVWLLNIDMFGGITAYFGIKTDYSVKW
ncbi:MAG: hypothetical protein UGF89_06710 [Acutalibacteraceae bacterium]|nr:hypothetical protein [Acutalibacteraceae bacterium]